VHVELTDIELVPPDTIDRPGAGGESYVVTRLLVFRVLRGDGSRNPKQGSHKKKFGWRVGREEVTRDSLKHLGMGKSLQKHG
jgi:hypothetical protein